MAIVVEPHVASSILVHYEGKLAKNCRGWLIGTVDRSTSKDVAVTNFVPDTFNRPLNTKLAKEAKAYHGNLQKWLDAIKAPGESVIGVYSVGNGDDVTQTTRDDNTEITTKTPYAAWSAEYLSNPFFLKRNDAIHLDIRTPTTAAPTLRFVGKRYTYRPEVSHSEVAVRIVPESTAANVVADHIVKLAYNESVEESSVSVLELDRVLAALPDDAKVTERIEQVFNTLETAIANAAEGSDVTKLVGQLRQEHADANAASGDAHMEVRMRNALMIKLVVSRMQEYLQSVEQTMVRGTQRGRFDRR